MFDRQKYIKPFTEILSIRDLSDGTVRDYLSYLSQFLDFIEKSLGGRPPEDITWEEIRSYILYLQKIRNLNNRSILPHMAQMKTFFRYVLHRDWDPYQIPALKYDEYLPAVPTKKEMEYIITTMPLSKYCCVVAAMYSGGLRVSEAVRLRYDDISRSHMQIHVAKTKNRAERKAILAKKTLEMLTRYWLASGLPREGYLFPGQKPDSHISTEAVRIVMRDHLASIGMGDKGYTPHSCRHCFGQSLYDSGADIYSIKEAMGHKSISSTAVYVSLGIGGKRSLKSPFDMED